MNFFLGGGGGGTSAPKIPRCHATHGNNQTKLHKMPGITAQMINICVFSVKINKFSRCQNSFQSLLRVLSNSFVTMKKSFPPWPFGQQHRDILKCYFPGYDCIFECRSYLEHESKNTNEIIHCCTGIEMDSTR